MGNHIKFRDGICKAIPSLLVNELRSDAGILLKKIQEVGD